MAQLSPNPLDWSRTEKIDPLSLKIDTSKIRWFRWTPSLLVIMAFVNFTSVNVNRHINNRVVGRDVSGCERTPQETASSHTENPIHNNIKPYVKNSEKTVIDLWLLSHTIVWDRWLVICLSLLWLCVIHQSTSRLAAYGMYDCPKMNYVPTKFRVYGNRTPPEDETGYASLVRIFLSHFCTLLRAKFRTQYHHLIYYQNHQAPIHSMIWLYSLLSSYQICRSKKIPFSIFDPQSDQHRIPAGRATASLTILF